jgi:phosphonoacetaldehyde hydrolase
MSEIVAVIFDWAGTMIDFGCVAPVRALQAAFAAEGVRVNEADARADMGVSKRDHVRALMQREAVVSRWVAAHGAAPVKADGDRLYRALEPLMEAAAAEHSQLVPGAADLVAGLRARGVKIGSGTGYTRAMMRPILGAAAAQGYAPDVTVCAGETPSGRPSPLMMWQALIALDAWPAWRCVKVDDADVGIAEGRAAGAWTVGVAASGNGVGLDLDALRELPRAERVARVAAAGAALKGAGADFVIESVADLGPLLETIDNRIAAGARPGLR